jgi:hypothetical protein
MPMLRATTTRTDENRAIRMLLAWGAGDKFAFDVVMQEVVDDPSGTATPGILFALCGFTARLGEHLGAADFTHGLQARLAGGQDDDDGQGEN